jgi:carbonic anhydrase
MLGQHFDNIWVYYKDVTNRYNATNDPNTGISIDMVSDALKGLGMQLYTNTNVSNNVYYDLFGYNYDGSLLPPTGSELITTYVTSSLATVGSKDLQQEISQLQNNNA